MPPCRTNELSKRYIYNKKGRPPTQLHAAIIHQGSERTGWKVFLTLCVRRQSYLPRARVVTMSTGQFSLLSLSVFSSAGRRGGGPVSLHWANLHTDTTHALRGHRRGGQTALDTMGKECHSHSRKAEQIGLEIGWADRKKRLAVVKLAEICILYEFYLFLCVPKTFSNVRLYNF